MRLRKVPDLYFFFFFCTLLVSFMGTSLGDELSVCFWDIEGTASESIPDKNAEVSRILRRLNPDLIVLTGIENQNHLNRLQSELNGYSFCEYVEAVDRRNCLAFLAKSKPNDFKAITDQKYKLKNNELPMRRGILHAIIEKDGYTLHVIGAHLKSRRKHPEYSQTNMRRYEARLLRHYVTSILKKDLKSNILVLGNMNDTCGKSPIKDIYNRRFGIPKRLFDLRPLDSFKCTWTHWNKEKDDYERIDYAIASSALLPEVVREKSFIFHDLNWEKISSHRPILVNISCENEELWTKEKLAQIYPMAIYAEKAVHFDKNKKVGDKRKRNSPSEN